MAGVTAHGGTFSFLGFQGSITSLSVETPQAEIVDMTAWNDPIDQSVQVPTGVWTGGSVSVDFIHKPGGTDPKDLVRKVGQLVFQSSGYSVTRRAILESATTQAGVGELVRGTLKFRVTDYTG